ncbi:bifunctional ornithine acetyltransferase/N-acetylglutamate synthase [Methanobacterium spitsbergense]|uniref:Glutamate N-acetyltransferase n=1 Tax=Methanobacterium spitsbergense TaxID=2874285 RepID=A0A8T5V1X3_9EURY|nr:bifunctional ornithine acetyltransferase/N-acetylglutamate synthase [Methanobacterium spitsbergense]MBZ2166959.1 bifunctional ornithine acetyltransferase/N-acetylglutamate synthase [Methanobacterium spitsbergense]
MKTIEGGICAVEGVLASGSCENEYGVAVIVCEDSNASAVFTSNKVVAAPVIITKEAIENGKLSAIVANSGNANCFTGEKGMDNGRSMASKVGKKLDFKVNDVAVSSTGVIGRELPMNIINCLIDNALEGLENSPKASTNAAEAIMTTDTFSKEFSVETKLKNGEKVRIGGITKGSGMIAPNMGTMLAFITTDIDATSQELEKALKKAVDATFNMVVVDGDESTNDTVVIMANGRSKANIDENFQEALEYVCSQLTRMLAKDGEGATKFMEVEVNEASTTKDARNAAKAVVSSSLVKTALFGADPNWGRIVAAVGYSGVEMDERIISVSLASNQNNVKIVDQGVVNAFEGTKELEDAENIMKEKDIRIIIDLGLGNSTATAFGCDLSYDYVRINAEYTT